MAVPVSNRPITVDEYHAMADRGELDHLNRVELLNGRIIEMPPIGPEHAYTTNSVTNTIFHRLANRAWVRVQDPVALGALGEPIPDYVLARPPGTRYRHAHPTPEDIYLIVEVADSSAQYDLGEKAASYALAGVIEYWVLLIKDRLLKVHRDPSPDGYHSIESYRSGAVVAPLAFPDTPLDVTDLLG